MTNRRRLAALLALAFAALYGATTRGVFVFGDDVLVFQVTEALIDRGEVAVASPADRGDVARAVRGRDGRPYSKYGLGLSLAAVPFDLAGRAAEAAGVGLPETRDAEGNARTGTRVFAVGLTNALAGALAVAAMLWLATEAGFATGVAALLAAALGVATCFAHYAATFLSEPLAAAALAGAAAAALRVRNLLVRDQDPRRKAVMEWRDGRSAAVAAALSGALAGLAVLVKLAHLIAVLPLLGWLAIVVARALRAQGGGEASGRAGAEDHPGGGRGARLSLLWICCFSVFLMMVGAYNWARFGNWLESGYGEEAMRFTTPLFEGLAGLILSPGKGILWYAPPLLLALAGAGAFACRRRQAATLVAAMSLGPLVLAAAYYQWHGGGSWGPRLVVPLLPLWLLPAGEVLASAARGVRAARIGATLALGAGVLVVALGALVPFDRYHREVWPEPRRPDAQRLERMIWHPAASPLAVHARELPAAVIGTLRLLVGNAALPGPTEKEKPGLPDLAFARYGSHVLLQWTRGALLLAAAAGLLAARAAGRQRGSETVVAASR